MPDYYQPSQAGQSPAGPQSQDDTNTTMPVIQQNTPFVKNDVNVQGGSSGGSSGGGAGAGIGKAIGSIGGSIVGGPIGGAIGGILGDVFGGLFAEGGMVGDQANGYADGGQVDDSKNSALATGYLVGALHQKKYGGNPQTLPNAAKEIKAMLQSKGQEQPQGLAAGGVPDPNAQDSADQQLAVQSLMKALGMDNSSTQNNTAPQPVQNNNPNSNPSQNGQMLQPQQSSQQMPQGLQNSMDSGNPNPMRGYAMGGMPKPMAQSRGYAAGGPDMPMQPDQSPNDPNSPPPLQPGQAFQGDGSVKGPGTGSSDSIPAKLSNGEFVFSQPSVQFYGVDKLTQMNEKGKQGFAQAIGQVQANQQQGPQGGAPAQASAAPQAQMPSPQSAPQQPPMQQAKGGIAMRTKGSGYCAGI